MFLWKGNRYCCFDFPKTSKKGRKCKTFMWITDCWQLSSAHNCQSR